jgi:hypothetical protein
MNYAITPEEFAHSIASRATYDRAPVTQTWSRDSEAAGVLATTVSAANFARSKRLAASLIHVGDFGNCSEVGQRGLRILKWLSASPSAVVTDKVRALVCDATIVSFMVSATVSAHSVENFLYALDSLRSPVTNSVTGEHKADSLSDVPKAIFSWASDLARHNEAKDDEAREFLIAAISDVQSFAGALPQDLKVPVMGASEYGDIALQWRANGMRALVSFEGDGSYGYALLVDGSVRPGKTAVKSASELPGDLRDYLIALSS